MSKFEDQRGSGELVVGGFRDGDGGKKERRGREGKSGASLNGRMDGTGKLPTEATWGQTCNGASCT